MTPSPKTIYLISNGDFRDTAAEKCWPVQQRTMDQVAACFDRLGIHTRILPEYDADRKHGFVTRQSKGVEIFAAIEPEAPVVIVLSCWAYSHHMASSLQTHKGPILLLANFDGTWPGLVAMLNHAATLERLWMNHSRIWSRTFGEDADFMHRLKTWCQTGQIDYDKSHLTNADRRLLSEQALTFGAELAADILTNKRIMGQLDPGCMGMLNTVMDPAKLGAIGMPLELLSQSDLAEGMLNNADRPDVVDPESGRIVRPGRPIVHFNEGDIGSGIPQVLMRDILERKGLPSETTLHDIRWGREYEGRFIWVLEISGGAPPAHFGGWQRTRVYRQPGMYFPLGGGTCSGVSVPGEITWARLYERFGEIGMDCGTGEVVAMPSGEVADRLAKTTEVWPVANVHLPGYDRDQCMSSHMSNHMTIGYGNILEELVSTCLHLGIPTRIAGQAKLGSQL